jgi:hypothetical protein
MSFVTRSTLPQADRSRYFSEPIAVDQWKTQGKSRHHYLFSCLIQKLTAEFYRTHLLNRTSRIRKHSIRIRPNQPHRPHHEHKDDRKHHSILSDILSSVLSPKPTNHTGHVFPPCRPPVEGDTYRHCFGPHIMHAPSGCCQTAFLDGFNVDLAGPEPLRELRMRRTGPLSRGREGGPLRNPVHTAKPDWEVYRGRLSRAG